MSTFSGGEEIVGLVKFSRSGFGGASYTVPAGQYFKLDYHFNPFGNANLSWTINMGLGNEPAAPVTAGTLTQFNGMV